MTSKFPLDWYWLADDGRLFSSSRQAIVKADDAAFVAWTAEGYQPTAWPRDAAAKQTAAALQDVVGAYGIVADLAGYAAAKQLSIAQGGFTVNANASGAAVLVSVSTAPPYDGYLQSAVILANMMKSGAMPTAPFGWDQPTGGLSLTGDQIITMAQTVASLIQQSFNVLIQARAGIAAGKISTKAQVDALPWPANS